MPTVKARYNHGRWLADCPVCGEGVAMLVSPGELFVCYQCHPNILAQDYIPKPGAPGKYMPAPDYALRQAERELAAAQGQAYVVEFPAKKDAIEFILRSRPTRYMNWRPGESLEFLRAENRLLLEMAKNGL